MANDAGERANAAVRVVHSPDACQGADAAEDVAPPAPPGAAAAPSLFQLVAGDDGIAAGEEVTISYGHGWPAEPYFLLFGFVPPENPHESVVAYCDLPDLAHHYCEFFGGGEVKGAAGGGSGGAGAEEDGEELWRRVAARAAVAAEAAAAEAAAAEPEGGGGGGGSGGGFERLVVAPHGLDGRMAPALRLVRDAADAEAAAAGRAPARGRLTDLVVARLRDIRAALVDPLGMATSATSSATGSSNGSGGSESSSEGSGGGGGSGEADALVEDYRRAKLHVVDAALAVMAPGL
jgi:hypothetical protein